MVIRYKVFRGQVPIQDQPTYYTKMELDPYQDHFKCVSSSQVFIQNQFKYVYDNKMEVDTCQNDSRNVFNRIYDEFALLISRKNLNGVLYLLTTLEDPVNYRGERTLLHLAVRANFYELVQILLNKGANPNASDKSKISPLHDCVRFSDTKMMKLLLKYSADPRQKDSKNRTPMFVACEFGKVNAAALLNVDVNECCSGNISPLAIACKTFKNHKSLQIIQFLLVHQADVNSVNKNGETPIFETTSSEVIRILLKYGAEINHQNHLGETVLHRAVMCGLNDYVKILLVNGVDVEKRDLKGRSALHYAVLRQDTRALKIILDHRDIDLNKHLDSENTVQALFNVSCYNDVVNTLLCYGAQVRRGGCSVRLFSKKVFLIGKEVGVGEEQPWLCWHFDFQKAFERQFEKELKKLKIIKISESVYLYDFLIFKTSTAARYVENDNLKSLLIRCGGGFEKWFPHYGMILNYKIKMATRRRQLINSAIQSLKFMSNRNIPEHCGRDIFESFSDKQLKLFNLDLKLINN